MEIKKVTIAGGGTLGSQIAWQTAFMGFDVVVYDAFEKGLGTSRKLHKHFAELFISQRGASKEQIDQTLSRISYTIDLKEAVKDADLISESILWGNKLGDQSMIDRANYMKENYIDKGKMGVISAEGFYKYPNPSYAQPDFLN